MLEDRYLKDEQIKQACRNEAVWFPIISSADINIAKAASDHTLKVIVKWLEKRQMHQVPVNSLMEYAVFDNNDIQALKELVEGK